MDIDTNTSMGGVEDILPTSGCLYLSVRGDVLLLRDAEVSTTTMANVGYKPLFVLHKRLNGREIGSTVNSSNSVSLKLSS